MEHFWIVPLIAIVVWILSNLVRPTEPPKSNPSRPRRMPGQPGSGRPSRPSAEVDRVLQEIENSRKKNREPRPTPQVRPLRERPANPPPVPLGLPASVPLMKPPQPVVVEFLDVLPVASATEPPPSTVPILSVPVPRLSPAVAQMYAMIQSPASLRTTILLQTLLEPPRCRKRGRR